MPSGGSADTNAADKQRLVIASTLINPEWLKLFRYGDREMATRYYLQSWVNEKLKHRVSPKLLWNVRHNRPHDLALYFVPEDLLGAVWLQFAEVINGNRPLRQCATCKTWIVISPEGIGKRSNRFTCSNACRMKVYYGRQMEARRLDRLGLSIREIAKILKADHQRVRQWVERNRTRRKGDKPA